jgi:hypothetical protein
MQVMFFRQHFGSLAIGWSNADVDLRSYRRARGEKPTTPFFGVTADGVSRHPWKYKTDEIRVAVVGLNLYFEEEYDLQQDPTLFAKVEYQDWCFYLEYRRPESIVDGDGLPDPNILADELVTLAASKISPNEMRSEKWLFVKDQETIPEQTLKLLDRVCQAVEGCIAQGPQFFR